jgi:hypothetical protein
MGTIDEVASAAVFLCSDASAFITGATLVIDGGMWLRSAPNERQRDIAVGPDCGYALQQSMSLGPPVDREWHRHGEPLMTEPIALEVFTDFV